MQGSFLGCLLSVIFFFVGGRGCFWCLLLFVCFAQFSVGPFCFVVVLLIGRLIGIH